mgnify:CR=1 FL=1
MVNKEKIDSIIESQNNPKTRGFWTIIGIVGTSCWLIETVTTFDACQYMVQQSLRLMATGKKGLNGKYKVNLYLCSRDVFLDVNLFIQDHAMPVTIKPVIQELGMYK